MNDARIVVTKPVLSSPPKEKEKPSLFARAQSFFSFTQAQNSDEQETQESKKSQGILKEEVPLALENLEKRNSLNSLESSLCVTSAPPAENQSEMAEIADGADQVDQERVADESSQSDADEGSVYQAAQTGVQLMKPSSMDREDPMDLAKAANVVTDMEQIRESLTHLAHTGSVISVYTKDQAQPLLCRIVSVDEFDPVFAFEISFEDLIPLGDCTCVSRLHGATFQFKIAEPQLTSFSGLRLLQAEFPAKTYASNRRATARVEAPLGAYFNVSFTLHGQQIELPLYDFSEGGVGLRATPRQAVGLYVGRRIVKAHIELGDYVLDADLEVRLTRSYRSFLLGEQIQIGCQFLNLPPVTLDAIKTLLSKLELNAKMAQKVNQ